jgi:hypothetical protein
MSARKIFTLFGSIAIEGMAKTKEEMKVFEKEVRKTTKALNETGKALASAGKSLTLGITAPVLAATAAMVGLGNATATYADKLLDLQQITGLSTDQLQGLEAVAREAGVEYDGLVQSLGRLQLKLPQVLKEGGPAADAIKALGVNALDTAGNIRPMEELVPELVNSLQGIESVTDRNIIAQQIFGREMKDLAPVLGLSAEKFNELLGGAKGLAGYMDKDAIEAADAYRKANEDLKATVTGLTRDLSMSFMPILTDTLIPMLKGVLVPAMEGVINVVKGVSDWFNNLSKPMRESVVILVGLAAAIGPVLLITSKLVFAFKALVPIYKALTLGQLTLNAAMTANPVALIVVGIAALVAAGVLLWKNQEAIRAKFVEVWGAIKYFTLNTFSIIFDGYLFLYENMAKGIAAITKWIPGLGNVTEGLANAFTSLRDKQKAWRGELKADYEAQKALSKMTKEQTEIVKEAEVTTRKSTVTAKDAIKVKKESAKASNDDAKAAQKAAEDKAAFEEGWTQRLKEQHATREQMLAIEREKALAEADRLGADTLAINQYYDKEEIKLAQDTAQRIAEEKKKYEDAYTQKLFEATATKEQLLVRERETALAEARRLGADEYAIKNYYAIKEKQLAAETQKQIADTRRKGVQMSIDVARQLNGVLTEYNNLELERIDNQLAKDIAAINTSRMTEEEKVKAIETIQSGAEAKRLELKRKQAKQDKAAAIFNVAIATAQGIMNAFQLGPIAGAVFAAIIGALGIAQTAIIASKPIPFAEGGMVSADPGRGVLAQIGEGREDEGVFPMQTGAKEIAKNIVSNLGARAGAMPAQTPSPAAKRDVHLHVGTLIADELGLKHLWRGLKKYSIAEDQRTGVATA